MSVSSGPMSADAANSRFDHWLALWAQIADDVLSPGHAALFKDRATRIARSLRHGLGLDDSILALRSRAMAHPRSD